MTIWALALLAVSARAANVAPRASAPSGAGSPVRALPTVTPSLGGGFGGATVDNLDLRGTLPALPAPLPGLTNGIPAAYFVPPGALGYKKVDALTAPAAPQDALGDLAPAPRSPASAPERARPGGILPGDPASAFNPAALPGKSRSASGAGLMPALAGRGAELGAADRAPDAVAADASRLFDNQAAKPAVDLTGFSLPVRPGSFRDAVLSASQPRAEGARSSVPGFGERGGAVAVSGESGFVPDSGLMAIRSPLPGSSVIGMDGTLRDAVASPSLPSELSALAGGHAPLLARPGRLLLRGEGLVVSVTPAPAADALLKGRPRFEGPAPVADGADAVRRLVSTELIERGALLEAVSASDAAVGRGLLALGDRDVPGAMAGALKLKDAPRSVPPAPRRSSAGKTGGLLLLSLLPAAAFLAARRFL